MENKIDKKVIMGVAGLFLVLLITGVLVGMNLKKKTGEVDNPQQNNEQTEKHGNGEMSDFKFELIDKRFEEETLENGETNKTSEFTIKITNISKETKYIKEFRVNVKDKNGEQIIALSGIVESEIGSNETTEMICGYGGDLSNYGTLEYELVNE